MVVVEGLRSNDGEAAIKVVGGRVCSADVIRSCRGADLTLQVVLRAGAATSPR